MLRHKKNSDDKLIQGLIDYENNLAKRIDQYQNKKQILKGIEDENKNRRSFTSIVEQQQQNGESTFLFHDANSYM